MNKAVNIKVPFGQYNKVDRWLRDNVCEDNNVRWSIKLVASGYPAPLFMYELRIHEDYLPLFILTWSEYIV